MGKILVIGASGFLGWPVAMGLLADGHAARCLARNPSRIDDLAQAVREVVRGEIPDLASMQLALASVEAACISVHALSTLRAGTAGVDSR